MGDGFTWDTKNPEQDRRTARETWALCVEKLRSKDYDLLVFDELVYVLSYEMLPTEEVLAEFAAARAEQPALHIVVTGRDAPARAHRGRGPRHGDARGQASLQRRHPRPAGNRILRDEGGMRNDELKTDPFLIHHSAFLHSSSFMLLSAPFLLFQHRFIQLRWP